MKFNIANANTATMKVFDIDDEKKLATVYGKRMGDMVDGELLADQFKGYVFKITGGNDKQGFPMVEGVMKDMRVRLLVSDGFKSYRPRRAGERKRKSIRGCIVSHDIAILNLLILKEGDAKIEGLTDTSRLNRLAPKRVGKLRKLLNFGKEEDARKKVVTRTYKDKKGRLVSKRPKIQRLVTPLKLQRKRAEVAAKRAARDKAKAEKAEYVRLRKQRNQEHRDSIKARRSSRKSSKKEAAPAVAAA